VTGPQVPPPWLVVVGASAGGLLVLRRLLADLPSALDAAVLAVVHRPPDGGRSGGRLLAGIAEAAGGERLVAGGVLLAPADRHVEVVPEAGGVVVRLSDDAAVAGHRPSVDRLFASAARQGLTRVVAVVLSGARDDGAAGAALVELSGGDVVVQDPAGARLASMPASALAASRHGRAVPVHALGAAVAALVRNRSR
jgi:two-component system chemotaxis response regulator CheB